MFSWHLGGDGVLWQRHIHVVRQEARGVKGATTMVVCLGESMWWSFGNADFRARAVGYCSLGDEF